MIGTTAEGLVKRKINKILSKYSELYAYMPVPYGYGPSSLDYIICIGGNFIAIEAKAPGKEPTARQIEIIRRIRLAGGKVFIIDGTAETNTLASLERYLDTLAKFNLAK